MKKSRDLYLSHLSNRMPGCGLARQTANCRSFSDFSFFLSYRRPDLANLVDCFAAMLQFDVASWMQFNSQGRRFESDDCAMSIV